MQFQAICFDLDGTLLDSLADLAHCTNTILSKRGFPEHPVDAFRYFVGDGAKMLITRALPEEVRKEPLIENADRILRQHTVSAGMNILSLMMTFLYCWMNWNPANSS